MLISCLVDGLMDFGAAVGEPAFPAAPHTHNCTTLELILKQTAQTTVGTGDLLICE